MEEAIRVCIRQRPLFQKEIDAGHVKAWKLHENGSLTLDITPPQGIAIKKAYAFDMCFDDQCTNELVFNKTARDIVRDTASGINGCYMAYGQTGCGKTHSIMGTAQDPGVLPRAVAELFDMIDEGTNPTEAEAVGTMEYLLRVSYVEIYLERVNDLFQDGPRGETQPLENLDVKEDPKGGFFVVGLAEREVTCVDDVMRLLQSAEMKRHFARTNFNETSSRSHTVFTTILESTQAYADGTSVTRRGELKLVDLAGNERASAAEGVEGSKERLAEGQAINKSLFLLSEVIAKLSKRADLLKKGAGTDKVKKEMLHIPWRDSKLTRLLQKALGGNSRACLLVAVHPSTQALEISLSTLRFALKTKQIKKKIVQNFVSPEQSLIMQQKETIKTLQAQLAALQQLTGVEAPAIPTMSVTVTAAAEDSNLPLQWSDSRGALPSPAAVSGPYGTVPMFQKATTEDAAANEAVKKLKADLQAKVEAVSRLILRARFAAPAKEPEEPSTPRRFKRSVTITGNQNRFERLQTLPETMRLQLYRQARWDDLDQEDDSGRLRSIAGTLKYLRRINAMNAIPAGTATDKEGIDKEASEVNRRDTVLLDERMQEADEFRVTMSNAPVMIRKQLAALRAQNASLAARNTAYASHFNYLKELFRKLGLSLVVTSMDAANNEGTEVRPCLSYSLAASGVSPIYDPVSGSKSRLDVSFIDYIRNVQPLARAMVMSLLCSVIQENLGTESVRSKVDNEDEAKNLQKDGSDKNNDDSTEDSEEEQQADNGKDKQLEEKVDSVFALLTPWEQYILASLYEQQELRKKVKELGEEFQNRIKVLQQKVQQLLAEKVELVEHSIRLVAELRHFRYEAIPKASEGVVANEAFGKLLQRTETMSVEVTEKTTRLRVLQEKYDEVEKERDELQKAVEVLQDRFFTLDAKLLPEDIKNIGDVGGTQEKLLREALLSRKLFATSRLQLEECRTLEHDLRAVNQQLWTELKATQKTLDTVTKEKKLVEIELRNERKALQKKFQECFDNCVAAEGECERLRNELAAVASEKEALNQKLYETRRTAESRDLSGSRLWSPERSNGAKESMERPFSGSGTPAMSRGRPTGATSASGGGPKRPLRPTTRKSLAPKASGNRKSKTPLPSMTLSYETGHQRSMVEKLPSGLRASSRSGLSQPDSLDGSGGNVSRYTRGEGSASYVTQEERHRLSGSTSQARSTLFNYDSGASGEVQSRPVSQMPSMAPRNPALNRRLVPSAKRTGVSRILPKLSGTTARRQSPAGAKTISTTGALKTASSVSLTASETASAFSAVEANGGVDKQQRQSTSTATPEANGNTSAVSSYVGVRSGLLPARRPPLRGALTAGRPGGVSSGGPKKPRS